jgi:hypothetical protein
MIDRESMLRGRIHTVERLGKPVRAGAHRITPYSRAITITIPGLNAGLVWNRPGGVLVQDAAGQESALKIPDVTRNAQLTLLAMGFIGALLGWLVLRPGGQVEVPEETA